MNYKELLKGHQTMEKKIINLEMGNKELKKEIVKYENEIKKLNSELLASENNNNILRDKINKDPLNSLYEMTDIIFGKMVL